MVILTRFHCPHSDTLQCLSIEVFRTTVSLFHNPWCIFFRCIAKYLCDIPTETGSPALSDVSLDRLSAILNFSYNYSIYKIILSTQLPVLSTCQLTPAYSRTNRFIKDGNIENISTPPTLRKVSSLLLAVGVQLYEPCITYYMSIMQNLSCILL